MNLLHRNYGLHISLSSLGSIKLTRDCLLATRQHPTPTQNAQAYQRSNRYFSLCCKSSNEFLVVFFILSSGSENQLKQHIYFLHISSIHEGFP
jgi:hypothetical protein